LFLARLATVATMPIFKLTVTATYSEADTVSRSYDVDAAG
jgi:hypothetical protein